MTTDNWGGGGSIPLASGDCERASGDCERAAWRWREACSGMRGVGAEKGCGGIIDDVDACRRHSLAGGVRHVPCQSAPSSYISLLHLLHWDGSLWVMRRWHRWMSQTFLKVSCWDMVASVLLASGSLAHGWPACIPRRHSTLCLLSYPYPLVGQEDRVFLGARWRGHLRWKRLRGACRSSSLLRVEQDACYLH